MRLLTVTHSHPTYPGDATAPFIAEIISALARRGHELDVVLPQHPDFGFSDGDGIRYFPYRYLPTDRLGPWGYGATLSGSSRFSSRAALLFPAVAVALRRTVTRLLSTGEYSAVHAHWALPNGWLSVAPAARQSLPLVVSLHGSDVAVAEKNAVLAMDAFAQFESRFRLNSN